MPKRIGIIEDSYARPLFAGLGTRFDVTVSSPAELAVALRYRQLDAAFLSPVDDAKDYAMYRIVPGRAAASLGESRSILLVYRSQLRSVSTLAVDPRTGSDVVLANILMAEKYGIRPSIVPVAGNPQEVLGHKADAAIVSGDRASALGDGVQAIDLVDEWTDLTGLPYVHGLWIARESDLTPDELRFLIDALEPASAGPVTAPPGPGSRGRPAGAPLFRYDLDPDDVAGLGEFLRMAYYHGILNDITDVKFLPDPRIAAA